MPTPTPEPPKPGYRTSEFIGKCAVQLIAVLVLVGIIPVDDQSRAGDIALALIGAVESAYAFSRGIVKKPPAVEPKGPIN